MARKSARPASPIAPKSDLFTAAERRLLDTSVGTGLARATHAELETATRQARILRDKWRGLSAKQGRVTKRAVGATTAANARSREKAGAFGDAVARLERRLAELVASSGITVGGKASNARAKARDKTIAGRAARRTTPRPEKPAVVAPAPRPIVRPVVPPVAPAAPRAAVAPATAPAKPKRAKTVERTISKKARVGRKGIAGVAPAQSLRAGKAGQRTAGAAAKAGRFAVQGATTHRKAHLAATGKRNQARRDGRKR